METSLRAKQQQQQQQQTFIYLFIYLYATYCYLQFVHPSTVKLFQLGGTLV